MVESFHRGAAAVVGADGKTIAQFGNISRPIYPRSAIKPLQAVVLVESVCLGKDSRSGTSTSRLLALHIQAKLRT